MAREDDRPMIRMYCQGCDWSYEQTPVSATLLNCPECYGSFFSSQPRVQCPQCGTKFALSAPHIETSPQKSTDSK